MPEERAVIEQGKRVYRYACTEEIVIGGNIWMRDRYTNTSDSRSYLLINFVDTGLPAHIKAEPKPDPKPRSDMAMNIRQHIRDLERKERLGG